MTRDIPRAPLITTVGAPASPAQRAAISLLRGLTRASFKLLVRPPFTMGAQRVISSTLARCVPVERGLDRSCLPCGGDLLRPAVGVPDGAVLYLHGGAFCMGSAATHRAITSRLASRSHSEVWVPNYRLAPEHPYPAALDDALECFRQMLIAGHPADRIVLAGDSAGAGLALALAFRLREQGLPMPGGLLLCSPWVDLSFDGESMRLNARLDPMLSRLRLMICARHYRGDEGRQNPGCSPLFAEFGGMPPMLIQVGSDELLLDDAIRLAQRAAVHGADVRLTQFSGMWHGFQLHAGLLPIAATALDQAGAFIAGCRQLPVRSASSATKGWSASRPAWSM